MYLLCLYHNVMYTVFLHTQCACRMLLTAIRTLCCTFVICSTIVAHTVCTCTLKKKIYTYGFIRPYTPFLKMVLNLYNKQQSKIVEQKRNIRIPIQTKTSTVVNINARTWFCHNGHDMYSYSERLFLHPHRTIPAY